FLQRGGELIRELVGKVLVRNNGPAAVVDHFDRRIEVAFQSSAAERRALEAVALQFLERLLRKWKKDVAVLHRVVAPGIQSFVDDHSHLAGDDAVAPARIAGALDRINRAAPLLERVEREAVGL